ncbi:NAD-dependent epimerase/dehydratase family protein [Flavobacterium sp. '19STA2R22 D10 B1']|uniref:NAD-dependent epimerase/dehydratase family protein n=1 Tax=Flavobacterium aerium TaxID=3037261 RepID=UPI00278C4397|nr:NAD-dependent epimerase/dehydratase family protein [Flavobacterium sp. '19STA2R22 D10 B1']
MVLVTGATGLAGSHLIIHLLENGESVRAIYRNSEKQKKVESLFQLYGKNHLFQKIEWFKADITDIPSLEDAFHTIDYVYHCAALISFDPKDEDALRKTNIEGTANVVNLAIDFKIKKFCFVSSIAALGDLLDNEKIITEKTEWYPDKPHGDYAITKHGAEIEVWRAQQEGLDCVIINPGVILGPGFWEQGSGEIFSTVAKGLSFYTLGSTGFITVNDVVKIMYLLMKSDLKNEKYTLIAENIIFKEFIETVATAMHLKKPTIYAKPWMTGIAWRADWLISKLLFRKRKMSKSTSKSSHTKDLFSNEKIKNTLSYEFQNVKNYIHEIAAYYPKK